MPNYPIVIEITHFSLVSHIPQQSYITSCYRQKPDDITIEPHQGDRGFIKWATILSISCSI
jgi:hypothetical protein